MARRISDQEQWFSKRFTTVSALLTAAPNVEVEASMALIELAAVKLAEIETAVHGLLADLKD